MRCALVYTTALITLWVAMAHSHPSETARIDYLTHQIEASPKEQALYILRGAEFTQNRSWSAAAKDLSHAQKLGEPAAVSFELGKLHYAQNNHQEAYTQFTQYLQFRPDFPRAYLYRARASSKIGDLEAASADYHKYFAIAPEIHPGDFIAAAKLFAGSGKIESALDILDQGLSKLGTNAQLQRYAATLEVGLGRYKNALSRWYALESILGNSPEWYVTLAELYIDANDLKAAQQSLNIAKTRLADMRVTTARQALHDKITALHHAISVAPQAQQQDVCCSEAASSQPHTTEGYRVGGG
ncbi:MAG: hypothetical protein AAF512_08190, partial [Pseudomonadota bacterium]